MSLFQEVLAALPTAANLAEKVKALEVENAQLKRELQDARRLYQMCQNKNQELAATLAGIGKFHRGVMFRRNVATGQKWMPFCPVCDTVLQVAEPPYSRHGLHCPKQNCGFRTSFPSSELEKVTAELGD